MFNSIYAISGGELGEPEASERALSWYFKVDGLSLVLTSNFINSGKNKITKMEGMEALIDLKILSIQVW